MLAPEAAPARIWGASKVLLVLLVSVVTLTAEFNLSQFETAYRWPDGGTPTLASRFSTWDIAHYLRLSKDGYEPGSPSCAFYPLWPASIRVATVFTGGRAVLAGTLLANALSVVAFWLFYRLVEHRYDVALSRDALILMVAFPGALFFSFAYTESLYLVLVLSFFLGLEFKRYSWVAVAGFLMPLARPVGVFILLPLAWHLHERYGLARSPNTTSFRPAERSFGDRRTPWLLLVFPVLGYATYLGIMHLSTGNAFEGFEAQKSYPNSPSITNMFDVSGFWNALTNVFSIYGMMDSGLDRACFLLVLLLLPLAYRLDKTWFWYTFPTAVVPALTSWFMSYRRYTMVLFPIFIVLAQLLAKTKNRWVFWYYIFLMAALQAVAVKHFVNFDWAG